MRRNAILIALCLAVTLGIVSEASAKRVALVIANSDYEYAEKLENPGNDARAIADAFRRLDFDKVTLKENLNYRNLRLALKDFANESAGAELAMVYFAGHGIEVSGQNYLIPTDARLESATDIDFEGIPLPSVMSSVEGANNLKLVILDACRNNPFRSRMALRSGTRSIGRGLAPVEPENNTMVAFAAKEGTVALDGDGEHSPYANALLQVIEQPGVEIGFMFRRVRDLVLKATGSRQEPFTYGSLGGTPIYLKSPGEDGRRERVGGILGSHLEAARGARRAEASVRAGQQEIRGRQEVRGDRCRQGRAQDPRKHRCEENPGAGRSVHAG